MSPSSPTRRIWRLTRLAAALAASATISVTAVVAAAPANAATAHAATAGATGEITGIAAKCVDDSGDSGSAGAVVGIYDCNGTSAQSWYVGSDGTLRHGGSSGLCIDVVDQGAANGDKVDLAGCDGDTSQQWTPQSDGALLNADSGLCLDAPSADPTNGTQLDVYSCNGTVAQDWNLPTGAGIAVTAVAAQSATDGVATGLEPTATGGNAPYQWSATGLPPGLSVNYIDGDLQGAPTATGTYSTTLTATDVTGETASRTFTWTVSAPTAATSYYVDCADAGDGTGTESSPWSSLATVNSQTFQPGDSVLFAAGSTCTGQLAPQGSGTATAPITIGAYGSGADPVIAGNGVVGATYGSGTVGGGAVQLTNQSYWIIQDLDVTNSSSTQVQRDGIDLLLTNGTEQQGITIRNNIVTDVTGYDAGDGAAFWLSHGIGVDSPNNGSYVSGLSITGNYIHDTETNGIGVYGDQTTGANDNSVEDQEVLVSGNTIEHVANDGIVICIANSPLIQDNTADQIGVGVANSRNFAGVWGWSDNNPTFQGNEVSNLAPSANDGEAFDCDGYITGTCTYQDNYDHDNVGGILLDCTGCGGGEPTDVVFRDNVSVNDCRLLANVGDEASFTFANNTVYCPNQAWNFVTPASYQEYVNNIFVGKSGSSLTPGADYIHNDYYGFSPPTTDPSPSTANPDLVAPGSDNYGTTTLGGYQLSAGSPDLGAGWTVPEWSPDEPADYGQDLWGNPASSSINIGAYLGAGVGAPTEFSGAGATYSGAWTGGGCSSCIGDSDHYTDQAGATATFTATGSTISVYASKTSLNGIAAISIDGAPAVDVDLYTPGPEALGQLVYTSPRLAEGQHTVTITCTGQADPRGGGDYISQEGWSAAS